MNCHFSISWKKIIQCWSNLFLKSWGKSAMKHLVFSLWGWFVVIDPALLMVIWFQECYIFLEIFMFSQSCQFVDVCFLIKILISDGPMKRSPIFHSSYELLLATFFFPFSSSPSTPSSFTSSSSSLSSPLPFPPTSLLPPCPLLHFHQPS